MDCSESDWKVFRRLREVALERSCNRVLGEIEKISQDADRTAHERYLAIFELLRKRDREVAAAFENPRRSQMMMQLAAIGSHSLLTTEELAQFSEETQRDIAELL